MAGYQPLRIAGNQTGLVQNRENFLLPDDAYPTLQNAYVWRERLLRKMGYQLLGRLQRNLTGQSLGSTNGGGGLVVNIISFLSLEPTAQIVPGSVIITIGASVYTDTGLGTFSPNGTINYASGAVNIAGAIALTAATAVFSYYPGLPVMGIRQKDQQSDSTTSTIFFDQVYAYIFNPSIMQFEEWIPGTTWNASRQPVSGTQFFFSTNYWVSSQLISVDSDPPAYQTAFTSSNLKLFWVTNRSGQFGALADPPRITDGITWLDFYHDTSPTVNSPWAQIDATNFLTNWLCMLPFRGRMVTFNTWEGPNSDGSLNYSNRIRWCTIGNPFIPYAAGPPATGSWRSDIRGQGGFLDIPTSEDIVAVGFVRDNLVIYCERSTWQLRYTGRSISPFQIERVNSELGAESTFSAIQFDTSLLGIGDKGIVECDSYKSERIDIKIPDYVFQIQSPNDGEMRVQGVRDFPNRLAFWTVPISSFYDPFLVSADQIFPNQRLVYNYENDSWALFNDSLTALGTYQEQTFRTWINTPIEWIHCDFNWISQPQADPVIVGGNQQGFIENLDELTTNDVSLYISAIDASSGVVVITSPNHNMSTGFVIGISGILGSGYSSLNNGIFGIVLGDNSNANAANQFRIYTYNPTADQFNTPVLLSPQTYIGGGLINIRENFNIVSKKFNFIDQGESVQMGYIDLLMEATEPTNPGAITLNVYLDYDDSNISNRLPNNQINTISPFLIEDKFFNSIIPTSASSIMSVPQSTKFWQRIFCPTRSNFITLEYTFSNAQMAGIEQELDVQIDAQILWLRKAGRITQI